MQYMKQYITLRKANGIQTQVALAAELKISAVHINRLIRGKRPLTANIAEKMAKVTGLSPSYWLNLSNEEMHKGWVKK